MAQAAAIAETVGSGRYVGRHFPTLPSKDVARTLLDDLLSAGETFAAVAGDRPLALYGGGNLGQMAKEFLEAVGRDFDFVIDRNAEALRQHPLWKDRPIYAPDAVPAHLKQGHLVLVTVVTAPYLPLETMLAGLGFAHIAPFYDFAEGFRSVHSLSNGWYGAPLTRDEQGRVGDVLACYHDDASRAHHLQFLAWRLRRQEWTFDGADVANHNRFFIPEVMGALAADPVFLDGGAHHGSVSLEIARQRPDIRKIVAVEPDAANRHVLEGTIREAFGSRASIVSQALGASTGKARFHAGLGYASQISPIGADLVEVVALDGLEVEPDFVKLHLEGGELDALKGGLGTFRKRRPIIAATVYHNADGLWRTSHWLLNTLDRYRILFRTHSWCGTGAVVYAIPAERMAA